MKSTLAIPGIETSAPEQPERSALEPGGSYRRRLTKWASDNAKWRGQKRAIEKLDVKTTAIPKETSNG